MAYRPAAVIDLYLYTEFHGDGKKKNFIQIEETFCGRTDVRTYVRTYGRTNGRTFSPSILLGRLSEVDLKITLLASAVVCGLGTWSVGYRYQNTRKTGICTV